MLSNNAGFFFVLSVFAMVGIMGLVGRWVFKRDQPKYGARELKLLTVLVSGVPRTKAMELRARLGDAGIRSAVDNRFDGSQDILVFYGDVERAKELIG